MTIKECPNCGRRYAIQPNSGDFIHQCDDLGSNPTLSKEDVVWSQRTSIDNFDGTNTEITQGGMTLQKGLENKSQFSDAGIEGEDVEDETKRGVRKSTHRTRSHYEHIDG